MTNANASPTHHRPRTYLNAALSANALLLGALLIAAISGGNLTSVSQAQPFAGMGEPADDPSGRVSAAAQRKDMINELRAVQSRLDRIEQSLAKGVSVKVTSMPAGLEKALERLSSERAERAGRGEARTESN